MKSKNVLLWICRVVAAIILLQTLYFKFTAAPESVFIFSQVGMEPEGRIAMGIAELITAVLILVPATSVWGAFIALILMMGAIATHVLILGVEVQQDGGQLFIYAIIVAFASVLILVNGIKKKRSV